MLYPVEVRAQIVVPCDAHKRWDVNFAMENAFAEALPISQCATRYSWLLWERWRRKIFSKKVPTGFKIEIEYLTQGYGVASANIIHPTHQID
jgi:hypothetical protein